MYVNGALDSADALKTAAVVSFHLLLSIIRIGQYEEYETQSLPKFCILALESVQRLLYQLWSGLGLGLVLVLPKLINSPR